MNKRKQRSSLVRKTVGMFVASLFGFLLLAAVGAYWGFVMVAKGIVAPPATVSPGAARAEQAVKVYFSNTALDKNANDCRSVHPVLRYVPSGPDVAREALERLFAGTSLDEANGGYYTSINAGVKINYLTVANGAAHVDLDKTIEAGLGGSCRVAAIRAQIEQTLEQFPEAATVIISVDRRVADALQP